MGEASSPDGMNECTELCARSTGAWLKVRDEVTAQGCRGVEAGIDRDARADSGTPVGRALAGARMRGSVCGAAGSGREFLERRLRKRQPTGKKPRGAVLPIPGVNREMRGDTMPMASKFDIDIRWRRRAADADDQGCSMSDYFSDRELGPKARVKQEMDPVTWAGIAALAASLANSGAFGASFPERCPDGQAICGNEISDLKSAIEAELHGLTWPLQTDRIDEEIFIRTREPWAPPTLVALDFVEFVWRKVALPVVGWHHDYHRHHHLTFDIEAGRSAFRSDVNRILARNGMAYELGEDGGMRRLLPAVLGEALVRTYFRTGDRTLDVMLEESRTKFSDPDPLIRREALERLFDTWGRIKSLADANKAKSVQLILDRCASEPAFREVLEKEARELTQIGNGHLLRHHERNQTPVIDVDHVDYLYHRLFALVELVIRRNSPR